MKRSRSTNDAGELPNVEKDIVEEILTRVPPRSLMRFKCVSNSFKDLISNNRFCNLHLKKSLEHNCINLMNLEDCITTLVYDYRTGRTVWNEESEERQLTCLAECHGLFCAGFGDNIYLLNPSTQESREVPSTEIGFPRSYGEARVFFGLGYNSADDDYKLVQIAKFEGVESSNEVKIFSRNTGTWNRIDDLPYEHPHVRPGVFGNGRIHWVVSRWNYEAKEYRRSIAALNLTDYRYSLIQTLFSEETMSHIDICTLGEKLAVFQHTTANASEIWILNNKSGGQPWTRIRLQTNCLTHWSEYSYFQPLGTLNTGEILIRVGPKKLIRFDVAKKHISAGFTPWLPLDCPVISYVESIVRPYGAY